MKYLIFASLAILQGCASTRMGNMTRTTDQYGQETICWQPSNSFNNVVGFFASATQIVTQTDGH